MGVPKILVPNKNLQTPTILIKIQQLFLNKTSQFVLCLWSIFSALKWLFLTILSNFIVYFYVVGLTAHSAIPKFYFLGFLLFKNLYTTKYTNCYGLTVCTPRS